MRDRRFPRRVLRPPPPFDDELLSSWLLRVVATLGMTTHGLASRALNAPALWARDVDSAVSVAVVDDLTRIFGVDRRVVQRTLLGRPANDPLAQARLQWTLPLGIYHRTHRRHGLMACPLCLADDAAVYFRREWRYGWATACPVHDTYLIDGCAQCDRPLHPYRAVRRDLRPVICAHCGNDLRMAQPGRAVQTVLQETASTLNAGGSVHGMPPDVFLRVFLRLTSAAHLGYLDSQEQPRQTTPGFTLSRVEERHKTLRVVSRWLDHWPDFSCAELPAPPSRIFPLSTRKDWTWLPPSLQPMVKPRRECRPVPAGVLERAFLRLDARSKWVNERRLVGLSYGLCVSLSRAVALSKNIHVEGRRRIRVRDIPVALPPGLVRWVRNRVDSTEPMHKCARRVFRCLERVRSPCRTSAELQRAARQHIRRRPRAVRYAFVHDRTTDWGLEPRVAYLLSRTAE